VLQVSLSVDIPIEEHNHQPAARSYSERSHLIIDIQPHLLYITLFFSPPSELIFLFHLQPQNQITLKKTQESLQGPKIEVGYSTSSIAKFPYSQTLTYNKHLIQRAMYPNPPSLPNYQHRREVGGLIPLQQHSPQARSSYCSSCQVSAC
jgi:hypothetical protein